MYRGAMEPTWTSGVYPGSGCADRGLWKKGWVREPNFMGHSWDTAHGLPSTVIPQTQAEI